MGFAGGYYTRAILVPVPPIFRGLDRGRNVSAQRSAIAKPWRGAEARGLVGIRIVMTRQG